jgi:hypothetical protein
MGLFRKSDPEVVNFRGLKVGPPSKTGWTQADLDHWNNDGPAPTCAGVRGKECKKEAVSGNALCSSCLRKL